MEGNVHMRRAEAFFRCIILLSRYLYRNILLIVLHSDMRQTILRVGNGWKGQRRLPAKREFLPHTQTQPLHHLVFHNRGNDTAGSAPWFSSSPSLLPSITRVWVGCGCPAVFPPQTSYYPPTAHTAYVIPASKPCSYTPRRLLDLLSCLVNALASNAVW